MPCSRRRMARKNRPNAAGGASASCAPSTDSIPNSARWSRCTTSRGTASRSSRRCWRRRSAPSSRACTGRASGCGRCCRWNLFPPANVLRGRRTDQMECGEFALRLDDLLDGRLHALGRKSIQEHMERCPDCRQRHEHAVAVLESVRKLTPPALHPGFTDQALSRATRKAAGGAHPKWRPVLGMALAASLVLGVALGVFLATRSEPVQAVALTIDRPETVRLMFNSAKPLKAATLSLALPENVELVGYGGRRELSWQTDLREGGNLMQLPLVEIGVTKDDLVASLSHGGNSKMFRLKIEVAGGSGM